MKLRRVSKAIGLVIAIVMSQFLAHSVISVGGDDKISGPPAPPELLFGKLVTLGNKSLHVNGVVVPSGTTIMPGAEIKTSEYVRATVLLKSLGRLDLAAKTSLMLQFGPGRIDIDLQEGCLVLTTSEGTKGSIKTPQGTIVNIDPARDAVTDVCAADVGAPAKVNEGAAAAAGVGIGTATAQGSKRRLISLWIFAVGSLPFVVNEIPKAASSRPDPLL